MVKSFLCAMAWSIVLASSGQQCTNVLQMLNIPLTTENMSMIVTSDHTTPDRLFLSFLKSSARGYLSDFLSLFTDTYLASEFGVIDTNVFSNEDKLDFQQYLIDCSVTNRTLVSYSCTISGNVADVIARMDVCTVNRSTSEDIKMRFIKTNDVWKINQW